MIEPYRVTGLVPTYWAVHDRSEIRKNLDHIEELSHTALWLSGLDIPVRLLAVPEGALQGFTDEIEDVDHSDYARHCAIDIPGPETDRLGALARKHQVYVMAQAKARHPDWKNLFFNVAFLIDPDGEILLKHHKLNSLLPSERSVSPHDILDWWIDKHGRTLDAFWPVADTKIGRIGAMIAMEGNFPENGRGLALNGAEVVYRPSLPSAFTANDVFEISNRARALENNFYVVAPNIGGGWNSGSTAAVDTGGGRSMIVDYQGAVVGKQFDTNGSAYVSGVIDIEALRHHRSAASVTNWLKDVRTELAQIAYEQPIYPKNRYLERIPGNHAEFRTQVLERQIALMQERGVYQRPSR
ncbi:nitrilase-related carbon-nitrogen hydrolase [Amycolatopsis sp. VS8301801F10]|uniref:nitrilase-related carbon-nitrogen hydrolase n=1 Tax=unclassified Amycolatopsis TaxID=2618356 RepID=UPI0038FCE31C